MNRRSALVWVFGLLTAVAPHLYADDEPEDRYTISVITVGPGDELFTRFGHIAIAVNDRATGAHLVYNFGTFNFSDPSLRWRYARGFLNYWLSVADFDRFVAFYRQTNRDMRMQELRLSPSEAQRIAAALEENAKPENRYYLYRHYLDNCCTRIRDLLDAATGGLLSRFRSVATDHTYRYWTARALEGLPLYRMAILYFLGPAIDHPLTRWDEQFLPEVLSADLDTVRRKDGTPLVARTIPLAHREGPPPEATVPLVDVVVICALLAVWILGFAVAPGLRSRAPRAAARLWGAAVLAYGLVAGLGGVILTAFWAFTTHYDTHYNENLLVTPPVHLLWAVVGAAVLITGRLGTRTLRWARLYARVAAALLLLDVLLKAGPFVQDNWNVVSWSLLCLVGTWFGLRGWVPRQPASSG